MVSWLPLQLLPPAAEEELHTVDLLSSIFMACASARDSNLVTVDKPRTAFPHVLEHFDTGIRVAVFRAACASELGWKKEQGKTKRGRRWNISAFLKNT